MESKMMDLNLEELKKAAGGNNAVLPHDEAVSQVRSLVRAALNWKSTFEDALSTAIYIYSLHLSKAEIEAIVREEYGM